ncbi:hypothetical protein D1B31_11965 [Neobacillus notoginsengisoli]|uniref:Uncharacterized protein n=1 Tax=Neobacillus notoginsengisoli TaxID=1578198 RepID=A0A417YT73_9BACI|nr:hypothetical protein D1B31_11965 [Neobacillus notoginsengisoli]
MLFDDLSNGIFAERAPRVLLSDFSNEISTERAPRELLSDFLNEIFAERAPILKVSTSNANWQIWPFRDS